MLDSGIVNIGYIISEVGRLLIKINQKDEKLYRSISDAEKLAQSYSLPPELSKRVNLFVINNQVASDKFNYS